MFDLTSANMILAVLIPLSAGAIAVNVPAISAAIRLGAARKKFKCMCCGNCCRFKIIPLERKDVERLEKAGHRGFNVKADGELAMRRVRGRCVFLKNDKCSVHPHRPKVCREFPFYRLYGLWLCSKASFCPAVDKLKEMV